MSLKNLNPVSGTGFNPWTKFIPEADVYRLAMRSQLDSAERFQDWVMEEVLPSIRRTGSYAIPTAPPVPLPARDQLLAELHRAARRKAADMHNIQQSEIEKQLREFGITDCAQIGRTCAIEAELLNETILGVDSHKFRQWYDVTRPNRQHMPPIVLSAFADLEEQNIIQMRLRNTYSQRAAYLEQYFSLRYPQILQYRNEQLSALHRRAATKNYDIFPVAPLESPLLRVPDALLLRLGYVAP
jgi:hypothetical protein